MVRSRLLVETRIGRGWGGHHDHESGRGFVG
jgi:hypothetical protein